MALHEILRVQSRLPRQLARSRCHVSIGSEAHVAAYKRPPLYKSERSTFITRHINKQNQFSLSIQLQIKSNKFTKSFKNIHGTLAQSEAIPATIHTKFIQILRIHHQVQFTEINRSRIHTNSIEFHTVLRDSE